MEQHPIPQQISSYEFRLVGNMTLKQFFKLAVGLLVAFVFYSSGLPFLIKWPFILLFAFLGFAMAFMPINDRSLDAWLVIFIKGIFSPTLYLWQKKALVVDILEESLQYQSQDQEDEIDEEEEDEERKKRRIRIGEFISSLPSVKKGRPDLKAKLEEKPATAQPYTQEKPVIETVEKSTETEQLPEKALRFEMPRTKKHVATAEAEFGQIPMPKPPTSPNVIVGMVTDQNKKIVEDAIIEIQDSIGNPVRALRTNPLGQFRTTAPLANGEYTILTEKENYQFDIIKIKAEGRVIPPLKIKSRPKQVLN